MIRAGDPVVHVSYGDGTHTLKFPVTAFNHRTGGDGVLNLLVDLRNIDRRRGNSHDRLDGEYVRTHPNPVAIHFGANDRESLSSQIVAAFRSSDAERWRVILQWPDVDQVSDVDLARDLSWPGTVAFRVLAPSTSNPRSED